MTLHLRNKRKTLVTDTTNETTMDDFTEETN